MTSRATIERNMTGAVWRWLAAALFLVLAQTFAVAHAASDHVGVVDHGSVECALCHLADRAAPPPADTAVIAPADVTDPATGPVGFAPTTTAVLRGFDARGPPAA